MKIILINKLAVVGLYVTVFTKNRMQQLKNKKGYFKKLYNWFDIDNKIKKEESSNNNSNNNKNKKEMEKVILNLQKLTHHGVVKKAMEVSKKVSMSPFFEEGGYITGVLNGEARRSLALLNEYPMHANKGATMELADQRVRVENSLNALACFVQMKAYCNEKRSKEIIEASGFELKKKMEVKKFSYSIKQVPFTTNLNVRFKSHGAGAYIFKISPNKKKWEIAEINNSPIVMLKNLKKGNQYLIMEFKRGGEVVFASEVIKFAVL